MPSPNEWGSRIFNVQPIRPRPFLSLYKCLAGRASADKEKQARLTVECRERKPPIVQAGAGGGRGDLGAPSSAARAKASRAAGRKVVLKVAVNASRIDVHREASVSVGPGAIRLGSECLHGVLRRRKGADAESARKQDNELGYNLMNGRGG